MPIPDRRRPSEIGLMLCGELWWPPLRDKRRDISVEIFIGGAALDDREDGARVLVCASMAAVLLRG
jgi:hypothetical protein